MATVDLPSLTNLTKSQASLELFHYHLVDQKYNITAACRKFGISRATGYRYMERLEHRIPSDVIRQLRRECTT